ncbi:GH1 family beta-glucosidase [Saccharothrix coeruleofusca]|uniref:Beta-glucosidase n=1 Tax=Saccharothrix coeruleofusca TaxID=33919 RepID=A0A918ATF2_9PSEU|nr:GH1 family beta-glucosidase [Saccharothrix coeruleofusca]MBP2336933.1 beta-glucosidase [Saccharothrix coeruleofusca]GGP81822.1 beta-glucosidase [Saccharothrix coeruleofusca]
MTDFPEGFRWGVATSSYQIEGAVDADGRGPSIWDAFGAVPGAIAGGDTGAVACDHYHRWAEDLDLLTALGVDSYRFSVAWPRVQPTGKGPVEQRGLDFYRRLVEGMRERGVEPFLTLYHWDLPQALEEEGGWRSRETALRFVDYALVVQEALGDLVDHWTTFNEPYVSAMVGYGEGRHAPGAKEGHGALAAAHHLQLGHGLAVRALREAGRSSHRFGIVLNQSPSVPTSDDPADVAAARRHDLLLRRQFTDPIFGGRYPADYDEVFGELTDKSFRHDGDLEVIGTPLDYVGINYYYRQHVTAAPHRDPDPATRTAVDIGIDTTRLPDVPRTGMGWPVEPQGLTETLVGLKNRYPDLPPVYVTENGCVYPDTPGFDDQERIEFLRTHLAAAHEAMAAGVDLRGYFAWSLLDNFEWAHGYKHRFGLVHVDYATQQRTPRASFHWYRDWIAGKR